jgi:branched-chain amino acid transport system ATP-binding protein
MLSLEGVSVRFGGVQALAGLDMAAERGTVTGLIVPNGAGKTTAFNVITGLQPAASGRVRLNGIDISRVRPHQRARLGIARTFQRLELFGTLTVRENVLVAAESRASGRQALTRTDALIERVGLHRVPDEPVDVLPTGLARLVELARALASEPQVLLLDEPASGLDENETRSVGDLVTELAGSGIAVLLVEHDLELVLAACSLVYVLDFGRLIAQGTPDEIRANAAVQAAYIGTKGLMERSA